MEEAIVVPKQAERSDAETKQKKMMEANRHSIYLLIRLAHSSTSSCAFAHYIVHFFLSPFAFLGWLELDLIMGTWAEDNLNKLNDTQLEQVSQKEAAQHEHADPAIHCDIDVESYHPHCNY